MVGFSSPTHAKEGSRIAEPNSADLALILGADIWWGRAVGSDLSSLQKRRS